MPLANEHTPFFYLFSGTCVDSRQLCLSLQRAMTPFSSLILVFLLLLLLLLLLWEGGILKIPIPSYFGFRDMPHPNIEQFAPASLNIFILCNGSQLLACTFNVTWRPEFPNNNIFARDWAVSRHSVAETMFCYSCCAARDSHRVTQRKQWF